MSVTDTGAAQFAVIIAELDRFRKLDIQIGWHEDVNESVEGPFSLAAIATVLEFGTDDGTIPARPALSSAIDLGTDEIADQFEKEAEAIIDGKRTALEAAKRMGIFGVKLVKKRIRDSNSWAEKLQESTVARKGSSKPLVDTGQLLNNVIWIILENGQIIESS